MAPGLSRARYAKVLRKMWNDERFRMLSGPPPNAQTLWIRFLTGPELTNVPGLFTAWASGFAEALRWPLEGFLEAFAELSAKGMAEADWTSGLVWIPNALQHNKPESPNVVTSWEPAWEELPECRLKTKAATAIYKELQGCGRGFAEAFAKFAGSFGEGIADPSPNQDQDQDQDQDQEQEGPGGPAVASPPRPQDPAVPAGSGRLLALPGFEASKPKPKRSTIAEQVAAAGPTSELEDRLPPGRAQALLVAFATAGGKTTLKADEWRLYLVRRSGFHAEVVERMERQYLDRAMPSEGKGMQYLLGMLRNEQKRVAQFGPDSGQEHRPGRGRGPLRATSVADWSSEKPYTGTDK